MVADRGGIACHMAGKDVDLGPVTKGNAQLRAFLGGGDEKPPRAFAR